MMVHRLTVRVASAREELLIDRAIQPSPESCIIVLPATRVVEPEPGHSVRDFDVSELLRQQQIQPADR